VSLIAAISARTGIWPRYLAKVTRSAQQIGSRGSDHKGMDRTLTVEEDAELRRLAALASFGSLGGQAAALFEELRARDRRTTIREPEDVVVPRARPATDGPLAESDEPAPTL
jgi:hypothetical protein